MREKSGRQGKLSTKGHKCNEARIPTNAFYLERKALLPGKQRHDTEIMRTCDQVINLEFDCRVQMYFCTRFHNGRNRGVAWDFEDVRTRINFSHREGSGGMLPLKILKFRVSEMPSPGFSAGHFQ